MTGVNLYKSTTPAEEKDLAQTPPAVVAAVEALLGVQFLLDVCALPHTKKARQFYALEQTGHPDQVGVDALAQDWLLPFQQRARLRHRCPAAFMNPPFSMFPEFTSKAASEAARGLVVVGCVKDDRSTRWWKNNVASKAGVLIEPDSRIEYLRPDGSRFQKWSPKTQRMENSGANFYSVLPVWFPWVIPGGPYVIRMKLPPRVQQKPGLAKGRTIDVTPSEL